MLARASISAPELGAWREFCLVSVLRNFHGLACWLVDSRIPLTSTQFPFVAPPHRAAYQVLFSALALFNQGQAAISFDAIYLSLPLRRKLVQNLLLRTQRPIKQVVQAVGFQNETSIIRAFKGWTGQPRAEFR